VRGASYHKENGINSIEIPVLTPRVYREYKHLSDLDVGAMGHQRVAYRQFSEEEQREIVFKDITTGEVTHTTILDTVGICHLTHKSATSASLCVTRASWQVYASYSS
jgi:hypothetical protein